MAQQLMQTAGGKFTTGNGEIEGNNIETGLSSWGISNGLDENVMIQLKNNAIHSLNDLRILENDQDIKDFVNTLSIKPFIMQIKLIKAIKAIHSEQQQEQKEQKQQS